MAIRSIQIHPDEIYPTQTYGPIAIISKAHLQQSMAEAAGWVDFAGGTLTLVTERHPTDAPNERVTIRAMIQWKDRTDARPQEEPIPVLTPVEYDPDAEEPDGDEEPHGDAVIYGGADEPHVVPVMPFSHDGSVNSGGEGIPQLVPVGDGLDDPPEDEDLSEIPPELQ